MRRAGRLFQIIQILRGTTRPVTRRRRPRNFEVSKRTVYRDISGLMGQGVPIDRFPSEADVNGHA